MARTSSADAITVNKSELKAMLREVVREVLHEELSKLADEEQEWELEEGSALWLDLVELKKEAQEGQLRLLTSDRVFKK